MALRLATVVTAALSLRPATVIVRLATANSVAMAASSTSEPEPVAAMAALVFTAATVVLVASQVSQAAVADTALFQAGDYTKFYLQQLITSCYV